MSAHNDATFLKMFVMIIGALVAFTVIILIAANVITSSAHEARGPDMRERAAIAERIQPVGTVNIAGASAPAAAPAETSSAAASAVESVSAAATEVVETASAAVSEVASAASDMVAAAMPETAAPAAASSGSPDLAKGKSVYDMACFACHATGAAGAPKLGDQALWAPRIAKGMDALNLSSLNGIGAMPAKGGRVDLSDEDVIAAVAWMVEQAK